MQLLKNYHLNTKRGYLWEYVKWKFFFEIKKTPIIHTFWATDSEQTCFYLTGGKSEQGNESESESVSIHMFVSQSESEFMIFKVTEGHNEWEWVVFRTYMR